MVREHRQRPRSGSAATPMPTTASMAARRLERAASTIQPPGTWHSETCDAADREHQADIDLGPFLRRQVDRQEGAKARLQVGDEEGEPVEPTPTRSRRHVRLL